MLHISISPETLFHIGAFPVSNTIILSGIIFLAFLIGTLLFRKRLTLIPGYAQNVAEITLDAILNLMDSVLGSRKKSETYLPLIATIFMLVLVSNWSGLVPGVGSIGIYEDRGFSPLLRAPSSDLNFTLAIATVTVIVINLFGIATIGMWKHTSKFINFSNPIQFFIGIIEFISELAKIVSFSFRLFGNIFAGEVLLVIVAFLVPYVIPLPFLLLEVFVGLIQAVVFSMLALVFIAIATTETEHH